MIEYIAIAFAGGFIFGCFLFSLMIKDDSKEMESKVNELENKIQELEHQLEESRAKEGHGALESMMDCLADIFNTVGDVISSMHPDEIKELLIDDTEEDFDND